MIKIGKSGETEKNPDKADEISKQNSEAGNNTEEKEYLTEEEMFADTPGFLERKRRRGATASVMDAEAEPDEPAADAETEYEEPAQAAETEPDEPPAVETESRTNRRPRKKSGNRIQNRKRRGGAVPERTAEKTGKHRRKRPQIWRRLRKKQYLSRKKKRNPRNRKRENPNGEEEPEKPGTCGR